jgi:hypothetical protein
MRNHYWIRNLNKKKKEKVSKSTECQLVKPSNRHLQSLHCPECYVQVRPEIVVDVFADNNHLLS